MMGSVTWKRGTGRIDNSHNGTLCQGTKTHTSSLFSMSAPFQTTIMVDKVQDVKIQTATRTFRSYNCKNHIMLSKHNLDFNVNINN